MWNFELFEPDKNLFLNLNNKYSNSKKVSIQNKEFESSGERYDTILYLDVPRIHRRPRKRNFKSF